MAMHGKKGQGQRDMAKLCVIRHGHAPRRSPNEAERAIEKKVRQAGKRECRRNLLTNSDDEG